VISGAYVLLQNFFSWKRNKLAMPTRTTGVQSVYNFGKWGTGRLVTRSVNGEGSSVAAERSELEAVLASRTFARSQRLIKLLEYISEKHFRGEADAVREYTIATEVLGRSPDFDPAEDAISRVEIHRLRKKLREYYATEGARDPITMVIPPGMYTPTFLPANGHGRAVEAETFSAPVGTPPAEQVRVVEAPPAEPSAPKPGPRRWRKWVVAAAVPAIGAAVLLVWSARTKRPVEMRTAHAAPVAAAPADAAVRIIAGYDRPQYIDRQGHVWLGDRYFEGGGNLGAPFRQFIARTSDPILYQGGRAGMNAYNIPLKPGNYELKLHFAETVYGPGLETGGGENSRVMDVFANGATLLRSFDIVSDAGGPQIADVRVFKNIQPSADGRLHLWFHPQRALTLINAIEIEPAQPQKLNPIRIVTESNPVIDTKGQVWEPDNYYMGGQNSNHWKTVTPEPELFANERYGHFSYAIPVADGTYTARLYFAETYWGPDNLGAGGAGMRMFDVFLNGVTLLRNFDIFREGGSNRAVVKTFHGLQPNAQGKLKFDFVPTINYASLFAIEVVDESSEP
jgi:Malectin domain